MASGESDFKSTNMSTDFEAALEETVTVLRSLDMNVDSSLDAEVRVIEATAKTETGIEESILGITELVHYDVRPVDDDSTSVINVQPEFNVSNNNANKETEKVIEDVPTSQSFDMCESYASNLPSDKDCENERWKFEAKAEFKTEAEFLEDNASPDGSDPCGAVSSNNSDEKLNDQAAFNYVPQTVDPFMIDTRISQDYERRVEDRFSLINRYCDTTYEPITFNSPRKRWMVPPGAEFDYLDYVVCYNTSISNEAGEMYHWHYVTFGLSDIHGPPLGTSDVEAKSGLGFELTFRVKHDGQQPVPPVWPVEFLQRLATYICSNKARVEPGDFFMWGPCLDFQRQDSIIRHIIMTQDNAFPHLKTPTGSLKLLQVVGVTKEEVEIAQNWKGSGLLELFMEKEALGGMELVTDMDRVHSIFESYPECQEIVRDRVRKDGSDLTGVNARILWSVKPVFDLDDRQLNLLCDADRREFERRFPGMGTTTSEIDSNRCFQINSEPFIDVLCDMTLIEREHDCLKEKLSHSVDTFKLNKSGPKALGSVHLTMDIEALSLLPLVFRGRIDHNRHFTFKSHTSNDVITFVPENMPGAFASKKNRFAAEGRWLHVCLSKGLRDEIVRNITGIMSDTTKLPFPKLLCYDNYQFAISVVHPEQAIFYKLI